MTSTAAQLDAAMPELKGWIGRRRVVEDELGVTTVRRVAAMLDLDPESFRQGSPLPSHWFSMFFPDIVRQSQLGPDGHANKGVVLPPIPLPRRMGAGRKVRVMGSLVTGQPATRTTEVTAIEPKHGRSGTTCLLTLRQTFETGGKVVAVEDFDALYRDAVPPGQKTTMSPPQPAPKDAAWTHSTLLSNTLVFRYSSVTWNAHRIHYDADYCRSEEGYPAVVHNGGLTMQLMLDHALKHVPGTLTGFSARLVRPFWAGDPLHVSGHTAKDGRLACWAHDKDGALCGNMEVEYA
jgi:3-methylfumaryl-CoA hydratase